MAKAPQHDPLVGQTLLEKLKVIRKCGGGGMGAVYEVEHLITKHRRALKLIRPEYVQRKSYMRRLIREAGVAGQLQTPYVVETYDAGTLEDGSAYVLMELLDGQLLIEILQKDQLLGIDRLVGIMAQVCEGVAVAHRAGIIHRDLKPENIFLVQHPSGAERVKILDFGISKFRDNKDATSRLTAEGTILGTPFYMSPEQASGREVDERTDVYAVGVMMYEALTGRLPFDAKSVGALFIKIAAGEYLPLRHFRPDVPESFAAIVEMAMHRERDRRYQSMESLRSDLLPYAPGELKIRAKTISDSPKPERSTVAYEEVPAPGRVPGPSTLNMGVPKGPPAATSKPAAAAEAEGEGAEEVDEGAEEARQAWRSSAISSAGGDSERPPAELGGGRIAWLAAAGLVVLATVVAVAIASTGGEEPGGREIPAGAGEVPVTASAGPSTPTEAEPDTEREVADPAVPEEGDAVDVPTAQEERPGSEQLPPRRVRPPIRRPLQPASTPTPAPTPTPAEQAGLDPNPYGGR